MKVQIFTPEKKLFEGEASSVTVPSVQGPFTMLQHHAAIVAILESGMIKLTDTDQQQHQFAIKGGFCEQHNDTVIICVEN